MPPSVEPDDGNESDVDLPERPSLPEVDLEETVSGEVSAELDPTEITAHIVERIEASYEHAGPLPSQHWFRAVEELSAGCTDLILQDYKAEREHARALQKERLEFDRQAFAAFTKYQILQLTIAGLVVLVLAVAGLALILLDKPVTGFVLLVGEIAALVLAFYGRERLASTEEDDEDSAS